MKLTHEYWEEINGSIFTRELFEVKLESGKRVDIQIPIAFNVGREVARHIVQTHNDQLTKYGLEHGPL